MLTVVYAIAAVTTVLAQDANRAASPDPTSALEFLGSYSAPSAVLETETSHTSAHPPSPSADRRLRELSSAGALLPPWPTDLAWSVQSIEATCGHPASPRSQGASVSQSSGPSRVNVSSKSTAATGVNWLSVALRAHRALQQGRYKDAVAEYERIFTERPACSPVAWNRALARAYARNSDSLTGLLATLPAAPSTASGRLLAGIELVANGKPDQARRYLGPLHDAKSISNSDPPQRDLLWAKAVWLRFAGDSEGACQTLKRLAGLEPASAPVWFALASVALEEARDDSRRLAQVAPDSSWNRQLEAEALATRYPNLAHGLAPSVVARNQLIGGDGAQSAALASDSSEQLYRAAHSALQTAVKAYAVAGRSRDFSPELHGLTALAAEQQDDEAAAFREYRAGLAQDPSSAILHAGLGHLYRERSEFNNAQRELATALRLDPSDPVVTFELGDVCLRLGDAARALDLLNRAIELDPTLLVARWSRGKAYSTLGDDQRAVDDLVAAAPIDSTGELQWQLARVYLKLGRGELAQAAEQRSEEQRRTHGSPPKLEDPRP